LKGTISETKLDGDPVSSQMILIETFARSKARSLSKKAQFARINSPFGIFPHKMIPLLSTIEHF